MSTTAKSAIILVSTLALGVMLGMVGQGFLSRERARRVEELRTPPRFVDLVEQVIQPRPEQRAAVRARLQLAAVRYDSVITGASARIDLVLDSMKASLAPILDERQRERLARMARVPDPRRRPPPRGESPAPPRPRDDGPSPGSGGRLKGDRPPQAEQTTEPPSAGRPAQRRHNVPPDVEDDAAFLAQLRPDGQKQLGFVPGAPHVVTGAQAMKRGCDRHTAGAAASGEATAMDAPERMSSRRPAAAPWP